MLKLKIIYLSRPEYLAAAFGRLCVETLSMLGNKEQFQQPPSGGCVLKHLAVRGIMMNFGGSRLRAAVC